jgi:hypothetical protein
LFSPGGLVQLSSFSQIEPGSPLSDSPIYYVHKASQAGFFHAGAAHAGAVHNASHGWSKERLSRMEQGTPSHGWSKERLLTDGARNAYSPIEQECPRSTPSQDDSKLFSPGGLVQLSSIFQM